MLRRAGWDARPYNGPVAAWVDAQASPGFDGLAVSSVDGLDGRLEVTDVLARTTVSVGVKGLRLHVQREVLGDGWACPFCDFVDATPALGRAGVIAQQTGVPIERVAALLVGDGRLDEADVAAAVAAGRLRPERAAGMVGRRLADLVARAYAEAPVPVDGGAPVVVPAPYVSWLAGALAAAEVVKWAVGAGLVDRRIDVDMSGVPTGFVLRRPADVSGRCACSSAIRRRWMARLYPAA
jgi:hypothetical protein